MEQATINKPSYKMTNEQRDTFISILLLDSVINFQGKLPVMMDDDYKILEPLVIRLYSKGYLQIDGANYKATKSGRQALENFMQRYSEYLKVYDVFAKVDLTAGIFAFTKIFDFETDDEWFDYLNQENWEDLRIAVAEFKKLNPLEIVFMSFINEQRFDTEKTGWQFNVVSGLIWDEIEQICNAALCVTEVNQGDDSVMPDIIKQGSKISIDNIKREGEIKKTEAEFQQQKDEQERENEVIEETTTETTFGPETYYRTYDYYEPYYYDPFYISPIWILPILLW